MSNEWEYLIDRSLSCLCKLWCENA